MTSYSLSFIEDNPTWVGQGMDLQFHCIFQSERVQLDGLKNLIKEADKTLKICRLVVYPEDNSPRVMEFGHEQRAFELRDLQLIGAKLPSEIYAFLRDDRAPEMEISILFLSPDTFEIGAVAEYYFSGDFEEDRRRVGKIVDLLLLSVHFFGDAIGRFGFEYFGQRVAEDQVASGAPANFTERTDRGKLIDQLLEAINETRIAEESVSQEGDRDPAIKPTYSITRTKP